MTTTTTKTTTPSTQPTTTKSYDLVELKKKLGTKSAMIRYLLADGNTRGQVSKILNIRYQHVRNVEITPIKKAVVVTEQK